jgi:hypothetical protein
MLHVCHLFYCSQKPIKAEDFFFQSLAEHLSQVDIRSNSLSRFLSFSLSLLILYLTPA